MSFLEQNRNNPNAVKELLSDEIGSGLGTFSNQNGDITAIDHNPVNKTDRTVQRTDIADICEMKQILG